MIAGQILWLDFRRDAVPKEANKLRPAIVVEGSNYFDARFPNLVVVPCTTRLTYEVPALCVRIDPSESNGFDRLNWAVAHALMSVSKRRVVEVTENRVSDQLLAAIRKCLLVTLGM